MSYICDDCDKPVPEKTTCNKFVTEIRSKKYEIILKDKNGFIRKKVSYGTEIVKELKLCSPCFSRRTKGDLDG